MIKGLSQIEWQPSIRELTLNLIALYLKLTVKKIDSDFPLVGGNNMGNDFKAKLVCISFFACIFGFICMFHANAEEINPINISGLSREEAKREYLNVQPRKVREELLEESSLSELLVTETWIAIGTKDKVVGVFDLNGKNLFTIALSADRDYELKYDVVNDGLAVYLEIRSLYYVFDMNGNLIEIEAQSNENIRKYYTGNVDTLGNKYYLSADSNIKNFFCSNAYSQIVKRNVNSEECVFWSNGYSGWDIAAKWTILLFLIAAIITVKTKFWLKVKAGLHNTLLLLLIFVSIGRINAFAEDTSSCRIEGLTSEEATLNFYNSLPRSCGAEDLKNDPIKMVIVGNDWVAIGTTENTVGVISAAPD